MDAIKTSEDQVMFEDMRAVEALSKQMFNPKLMALRAQNPFVNIMPLPNQVLTVKLAANTPTDINLPNGTKIVRFSPGGTYYVSRNGNAQLPVTGEPAATGSMQTPSDEWWYVEELQQISIIAAVETDISIACFTQL